MNNVISRKARRDGFDRLRQALHLRERFIHQTHIALEILQQNALRHMVFHHQRHVLAVGDQRHAVPAQQVIKRNNNHAAISTACSPGRSQQDGFSRQITPNIS